MKQTAGFALFGGLLSLFIVALTSVSPFYGWASYTPLTSAESYSTRIASDPLENHYLVGFLVGLAVGAVVGLTAWTADFRITGQPGNRMARIIVAGLIGAALGVSLAVAVAFGGLFAVPPSTWSILALYAGCGVIAYGLALGGVGLVLRLSDDSRVRPTVIATAWILPVGGILATAAGVGTARYTGFASTPTTWIATVLAAAAVVAASLAVARTIALRQGVVEIVPLS